MPKLIRLLVAFHEMMLGKYLEQGLAYGNHSINTNFTDVGGIVAATLPWVSSKEHGGYLLGASYTAGRGGGF